MRCCATAVLAISLLATQASGERAADDLRVLDEIIQRGIAEQRYPGAVAMVKVRGKVLYARAFGRHSYSPDSPPMRMDTIFDMASCTKVVAGTPAALLLVQDGRLRLDDPVCTYWPQFGSSGKDGVTLKSLLTHISGLKAYENPSAIEKNRRPGESPREAVYRHYENMPLSYPTGTRVVYSCLNLQVTAALVQRIASEPLEEMLRRRLWGPLGMRDTTYRVPKGKLGRCAPTAVDASGRPVRGVVHDPLAAYHGVSDLCPGNAGLFSTARDLARYADMILLGGTWRGKRIMEPESVRLMSTPQTPAGIRPLRSIGWAVYDSQPFAPPAREDDASRPIGHTGYTGTWIWLDPSTRSYIIFLTNRVFPSPATGGGEGASIDGIRAEICRVVLDCLSSDPRGPAR